MFWKKAHPLNDIILRWPDKTPFTLRRLLRSYKIRGITGSGKSSGSLDYILNAIVAHPRSTITMVAQKPEDRDSIVRIFKRYGRQGDLIIIEPGGKAKCNFLMEEAKHAETRGLVQLLMTLSEILGGSAGGEENDKYWRNSEERVHWNTVGVLQLAGAVTAPLAHQFITTAAYDARTVTDPLLRAEWQKLYHYRAMKAAEAAPKDSIQKDDWEVHKAYWTQEFIRWDEKPRSSTISSVNNILSVANTGICRSMTSAENNVFPSMGAALIRPPLLSGNGPQAFRLGTFVAFVFLPFLASLIKNEAILKY